MSRWCNNGYEMYKKSVTVVQSCSCANLNLLLFCCCKIFLLLLSRNFATIVTWRHTSFLYAIRGITLFFLFYQNSRKEMSVPFVHNRPFLSFRNYHFQKEAKFKIFFVTMNYVCRRTKIIFVSMASHLASLWNRGLKKLGNGLIQCQVNSEKTEMPKVVDSSD